MHKLKGCVRKPPVSCSVPRTCRVVLQTVPAYDRTHLRGPPALPRRCRGSKLPTASDQQTAEPCLTRSISCEEEGIR